MLFRSNNIVYLSNLMALEEWYMHIRQPFFAAQEFGYIIYAGLIDKLSLAKKERLKRLQILAEKAKPSSGGGTETKQDSAGRLELYEKFTEIERLFAEGIEGDAAGKYRDDFLSDFNKAIGGSETNYIGAIQGLHLQISEKGTLWLQGIVDAFCEKVKMIVPSLNLFGK